MRDGKKPRTNDGREVNVSPVILQATLYLADHGKVGITSYVDGESHTASTNPHGSGNAMDLGFYKGKILGGANQDTTREAEDILAEKLPAKSRFGADFYSDGNWSTPVQIKGKTFLTGHDTGGHLHFDVKGTSAEE